MSGKRILLVNLSRIWGGGEQWFFSVAQELSSLDFDVSLWVCQNAPLAQKARAADLKTISHCLRFSSWFNPLKMWKARLLLNSLRPDMIILNSSHELKTIGLLAHWIGLPNVIFRRGVSYPIKTNRFNHWLVAKVMDGFIANSKATYLAFTNAFPKVEEYPSITLNNGIDLQLWPAEQKASLQGYTIGMVARLSAEKGIERAIEAMAEVKQRIPEARLHILGEGKSRGIIESYIADLKLEDTVVLEGFSENVVPFLQKCRCFVFTPHFGEGTSIALVEAMAMGLPCVVMDTPAMKEVVVHQQTGYLIGDGNISALAKQLILLLEDDALVQKLGSAARERFETSFTLQGLVKKLAAWIRTLA